MGRRKACIRKNRPEFWKLTRKEIEDNEDRGSKMDYETKLLRKQDQIA